MLLIPKEINTSDQPLQTNNRKLNPLFRNTNSEK